MPLAISVVPSIGSTATSHSGPSPQPTSSPLKSIGASSFSPSPMTTTPRIDTVPMSWRIASTAAPSPPFLSPRPTQRPAAIAAASVTRTSSSARLRSGASGPCVRGLVALAASLMAAPYGRGRRRAGARRWQSGRVPRRDYDPAELGPAVYPLLNSVVVPRPIAWVSTRSATGVDNLAPHSFFTISSVSAAGRAVHLGRRQGLAAQRRRHRRVRRQPVPGGRSSSRSTSPAPTTRPTSASSTRSGSPASPARWSRRRGSPSRRSRSSAGSSGPRSFGGGSTGRVRRGRLDRGRRAGPARRPSGDDAAQAAGAARRERVEHHRRGQLAAPRPVRRAARAARDAPRPSSPPGRPGGDHAHRAARLGPRPSSRPRASPRPRSPTSSPAPGPASAASTTTSAARPSSTWRCSRTTSSGRRRAPPRPSARPAPTGEADPVALFVAGSRAYLDGCWAERDLARLFLAGGGPPGFELVARRRYREWTARNATLLQPGPRRRRRALGRRARAGPHDRRERGRPRGGGLRGRGAAERLAGDVLALIGRIGGGPP